MHSPGNNPLVSVIVPTYNRAHVVPRAIASVFNQTFTDFELLIVDDGSTDDTLAAVQAFASPRMRYLSHKENSGASSARNTGIKASRGDYIAFLDSDDEWAPSKLEEQVALFSKMGSDVGVIYSGFYYKNTFSDKKKVFCLNLQGNIHHTLVVRNPGLNTSSALLKKVCFQHCGLFDESLPASEDWELFIRISEKYHFYPVKKPLVTIHRDGTRISTDYERRAPAHRLILQKHFTEVQGWPKALGHHYYLIGFDLLYCSQYSEARSFLKKSIGAYPFKIKSYAALLLSFCPQRLIAIAKALPR
jgi:glycosyltransferase involved in cell wall biosynthesis